VCVCVRHWQCMCVCETLTVYVCVRHQTLYVCVCETLTVYVCVRHWQCMCVRHWQCMCVWDTDSVCVCVRHWQCVCVCVRHWQCMCVSDTDSVCVCVRHWQCMCVSDASNQKCVWQVHCGVLCLNNNMPLSMWCVLQTLMALQWCHDDIILSLLLQSLDSGEKGRSTTVSLLAENKPCNRFVNIVPCELAHILYQFTSQWEQL